MLGMETVRLQCFSCCRETNQECLWRTIRTEEYEAARDDLDWDGKRVFFRRRYSVTACKGCDNIRLIAESEGEFHTSLPISGDFETPSYLDEPDEVLVERRQRMRAMPVWWNALPDAEMVRFGHEVYGALGNGWLHLAFMGMRRIVERMMVRSVGDQGSFHKTTAAFSDKENLGARPRDAIKALIAFGNAATHRKVETGDPVLNSSIFEVFEALLYQHYILPNVTGEVENATSAKPDRPKPPSIPDAPG
ncbi:MAG: DUF4145 domain-containing protein [Alphaproteobacteria bacterium]|nr:DUF4145 domain-containing protein [Alphaproteobacteria bacterium]